MESTSSTLILPPELERQIFEICAHARPVSIPRLMLVAWRVKEWLEPLLYRTIVIEEAPSILSMQELPRITIETMLAVIQSKPAAFFRDRVRHLYLREVPTVIESVLSACTGLENVWLGSVPEDCIPLIASLPMKHFYGPLRILLHRISPTDQFFAQLTQIELLGPAQIASSDDLGIWSRLSLLPQLTHLSFNDEEFIPVCGRLLEICQTLCVLVSLSAPVKEIYKPEAQVLAKDVRFVTMNCLPFVVDWQMGAHTGWDYWIRAEHFISQRRSGKIDALKYEIANDEDIIT
ncbi:hypothetical protein B0H19DRAFT_604764 [Mycena capillaripes]|nr:hypothetical protein B0H19DRAFT_604764 [Mycena capillaripes]